MQRCFACSPMQARGSPHAAQQKLGSHVLHGVVWSAVHDTRDQPVQQPWNMMVPQVCLPTAMVLDQPLAPDLPYGHGGLCKDGRSHATAQGCTRRGGGGALESKSSGTKSILPFVSFILPHYEIWFHKDSCAATVPHRTTWTVTRLPFARGCEGTVSHGLEDTKEGEGEGGGGGGAQRLSFWSPVPKILFLTDTRSTAVFPINGHCPRLKLEHKPYPGTWPWVAGKVGWWNASYVNVHSSPILREEVVGMRRYVCPACARCTRHAQRVQHPNECSGHLSQCFTPKHHPLL